MPPPVEPGDAPTNINSIVINLLADVMLLCSMVAKPALRGDTD